MKFFKSGKNLSIIGIFVLILVATGCSLISVPIITNAGRNDVVNLGDSIFALSGKIQD